MSEARENGHVLARIAGEHDYPRGVRPALELRPQHGRGAIGAAVVDEDHLVGPLELIQRRIQPRKESLEAWLLVVHGNDDRDCRGHFAALLRMSVAASTTRSTSDSSIAGKSGSVTVSRPMRSAFGNCPSR